MLAFIDGDVLLFRSCFAAEKRKYVLEHSDYILEFDNKKELNAHLKKQGTTEQDSTIWTEHLVEPLENALANTRNTINAIRDRLQAQQSTIFLSGKNNFRYGVATIKPYKGNRDPAHRPVHLQAAREYLIKHHGAVVVDGKEADDALGIEATKNPKESVIVTNDKDLKQVSCWHYNWTHKEEQPTYVDARSAGLYFFQQSLSGDATDNIPGIEGLGPVGAKQLLASCGTVSEAEHTALGAYQSKYGKGEGDRRFLETARLVKIHTTEDEINNLWYPKYVQLELG